MSPLPPVPECVEDEDGQTLHVFEAEDPEGETPRSRRCVCGETTYGEMDERLTLEEMWDA